MGSNHTVTIPPRARGTKEKNGKRRRSIARNYTKKCETQARNPCSPRLRKGHKTKPCTEKVQREAGQLGSNHTVKFFKGTCHHVQIRERRFHRKELCKKCGPQECSSCVPKFEDRSLQETLHWERCARREAVGLGDKCLQAENQG